LTLFAVNGVLPVIERSRCEGQPMYRGAELAGHGRVGAIGVWQQQHLDISIRATGGTRQLRR
jgi:hypothetical protein